MFRVFNGLFEALMQTQSKLAILELIAGLLGWVWLLASIASIYFLIVALAFNGQWSNFFWVIGVGVVAKWLTSGFRDHQLRVAYEAQLVSSGLSPDEARAAWYSAYTHENTSQGSTTQSGASPSGTSNQADLIAAQELVSKYGALLANPQSFIVSADQLPASKEQIKAALMKLARHAKATGIPADSIEPLRIGYASLANFVSSENANIVNVFETHMKTSIQSGAKDSGLLEIAESKYPDVLHRANEEYVQLGIEFDDLIQRSSL